MPQNRLQLLQKRNTHLTYQWSMVYEPIYFCASTNQNSGFAIYRSQFLIIKHIEHFFVSPLSRSINKRLGKVKCELGPSGPSDRLELVPVSLKHSAAKNFLPPPLTDSQDGRTSRMPWEYSSKCVKERLVFHLLPCQYLPWLIYFIWS